MENLRKRLPPPNALIAFEAVARHGSFTEAARELNVTRVAASSHVKNLESHIGVALFQRQHRTIRLTPAGEALAQSVSDSFASVIKTVEAIQAQGGENRLTVAASPSMATNWLMPRIARFRQRCPDVEIRFFISEEYVDLAAEGIDVGIRYGDGDWRETEAERLTQVALSPVCSPAYYQSRDQLTEASQLADEQLLHLTGSYEPEMTWQSWFRHHGISVAHPLPGLFFDDHHSLVQAALQGQGVALLGWPAVSLQLRERSLIRPIEIEPTHHKFIWLVWPANQARTGVFHTFCDWVREEMSA